jgi:3'-phosphoadenosine 5'-phosphosulfate sulfotransferase (PAPS reductase)/FAD synthetase
MTTEQIAKANADLRSKSPLKIVRWALAQAAGRAIVSTNFRPYEAVLLHLVTQVQPGNRTSPCCGWTTDTTAPPPIATPSC